MRGVSPSSIDVWALFAPLDDYRRLGLAVSGGQDSLALMLLAHDFVQQSGGAERFVVYTVDHGLRPEAAAEAAFVVAAAERLGFAARALRWEGEKPATGVQAAAREARYRLCARAMAEDGAEALVTAHHMADQAETVLMRLAHGSGPEGLRGMDYCSDVAGLRIVRPLLGVHPDELAAVVAAGGLQAVADPSNGDIEYERVRWRQVMPQLAALGLDARRIARFAERMRHADRALEGMTSVAFAEVATADPPAVHMPRELLRGLPRAVAVRLVGRALSWSGGGQKPHALAAVEALTDRLIREPVRTTLHGCIVRSDGENISFTAEAGRAAATRHRRAEPTHS